METFIQKIEALDEYSMEKAEAHWLSVVKPLFSLGKLETAVIQMAGIKQTADVCIDKKALIIMCADNGIVEEGVTQTGQEVTAAVAGNFLKGESAACIMAKRAGVDIFPVDIGMVVDVTGVTRKEEKIAYGTKNFLKEAAMTERDARKAILLGIQKVKELKEQGYGLIATGEMGIGNTTTSSILTAVLLEKEPEQVTGKGAGLTSEGLQRKIKVIEEGIRLRKPDRENPLEVLAAFGGYDIAGLVGVFLGGAYYRVPILMDGFISAVAALLAVKLAPFCRGYILPSHISKELGMQMLIEALELEIEPFLDCDMCLGEGTGAIAAIPVLDMGLQVYKQMSTFDKMSFQAYKVLE